MSKKRLLSKIETANKLGVSVVTIDNWVKHKNFPYAVKGNRKTKTQWMFDQDDVDLWMQDQEEEKRAEKEAKKHESKEILQARLEKIQVETKRLELRLKQEEGELVEIDSVAQIVAREYGNVRQQLLTVPSKVAPAIAGLVDPIEIAAIITDYIKEALEELSDGDVVRAQVSTDEDDEERDTA